MPITLTDHPGIGIFVLYREPWDPQLRIQHSLFSTEALLNG
jgi:hypothetical protein